MEKGYGNRLSLLYSIDAPEVLRPSLKGEEGKKTYYSFSSRGCTFFNEGKCELHNLGLKPWEGHVSHHDNTQEEKDAIGKFLEKEWKSKKAKDLIKRWKNEFLKKENK